MPSAPRRPQVVALSGGRLHLNDGPIDLVIGADGAPEAVADAHADAVLRLTGLLDALCDELALLRARAVPGACPLEGPVARRMWAAVAPFAADLFITPMAAVAGAVAQEILAAYDRPGIARAYVNNGGDIALHLPPGAAFAVGLVDRPDHPRIVGTARVSASDPVRGIATSGWRGRSFSLGIADAVTVLAPTAAMADAAATVIANAVDLPDHPGIVRAPAASLQPDSDLGGLPVTCAVPPLSPEERAPALGRGLAAARALMARGLVAAAALHLQGEAAHAGSCLDPLALSSAPGLNPPPDAQQGRVHA